ncbi:hypothetical protein SAMN05192588_0577 [Nonlabens sp. Hel1_33_55]|uniref:hypothetical protein n=1 Tax=Nonlabens sp. Hel1_33_55 TaxID=1336802 RepID=UPI000875C2C5|nr:hypothetical protein [Nonlabens sp. Hel1_33_55]SCX98481.1 hypothetical protein SAMN05192588_0577 [Nonlabens sp. Hel1_33_55]
MKYIITILFIISFSFSNAQEALAKIEFAAAETEYQSGNYAKSLEHLETVKEMLGSTNSTVMYLEIISRSGIFQENLIDQKQFEKEITNHMMSGATDKLDKLSKLLNDSFKRSIKLSLNETINNPMIQVEDAYSFINLLELKNVLLHSEKNLVNLKEIEDLSNIYLDQFKNTVPSEKLRDIYTIQKNIEPLTIDIERLMSATILQENGKTDEAKFKFLEVCENGNIIACQKLKVLNFQ